MKALSFVLLAAVAAPAAAQTAAPAQPTTPAPATATNIKGDPNRIICEREEEIGSRLASKKVCKTAAQWQEERREVKADIQRAQANIGVQSH